MLAARPTSFRRHTAPPVCGSSSRTTALSTKRHWKTPRVPRASLRRRASCRSSLAPAWSTRCMRNSPNRPVSRRPPRRRSSRPQRPAPPGISGPSRRWATSAPSSPALKTASSAAYSGCSPCPSALVPLSWAACTPSRWWPASIICTLSSIWASWPATV